MYYFVYLRGTRFQTDKVTVHKEIAVTKLNLKFCVISHRSQVLAESSSQLAGFIVIPHRDIMYII